MRKTHLKREPLLYVNQPTTMQPPQVNMQEVFSARKAKELKKRMETKQATEKITQMENEMKSEAKTDTKRPKKKKIHYLEDLGEETGIFGAPIKKKDDDGAEPSPSGNAEEAKEQEQEQEQEVDKPRKNPSSHFFQKVKSFREMNTIERLEYLHNFPKQLPPVPCLFQTENRAIRGYLNGKTNDEIEVLLFDKTLKTLSIKELKSVRMIGLN